MRDRCRSILRRCVFPAGRLLPPNALFLALPCAPPRDVCTNGGVTCAVGVKGETSLSCVRACVRSTSGPEQSRGAFPCLAISLPRNGHRQYESGTGSNRSGIAVRCRHPHSLLLSLSCMHPLSRPLQIDRSNETMSGGIFEHL